MQVPIKTSIEMSTKSERIESENEESSFVFGGRPGQVAKR